MGDTYTHNSYSQRYVAEQQNSPLTVFSKCDIIRLNQIPSNAGLAMCEPRMLLSGLNSRMNLYNLPENITDRFGYTHTICMAYPIRIPREEFNPRLNSCPKFNSKLNSELNFEFDSHVNSEFDSWAKSPWKLGYTH